MRSQAPLERVWAALIDVEQVAPCLPGAAVTGRNDDGSYNGTFKVKIGPTSAAYSGKLFMENVDEAAHTATMNASGTDKRGQGGAKATIISTVTAGPAGATTVEVVTDYHITGRLARFGRGGMIEEISNRLLGQFATSLQALLAGDGDGAADASRRHGGGAPADASAAVVTETRPRRRAAAPSADPAAPAPASASARPHAAPQSESRAGRGPVADGLGARESGQAQPGPDRRAGDRLPCRAAGAAPPLTALAEVLAPGRGVEARRGQGGDDPARVDHRVSAVVVRADLVEVDGLGDAGPLVQVTGVGPEVARTRPACGSST